MSRGTNSRTTNVHKIPHKTKSILTRGTNSVFINMYIWFENIGTVTCTFLESWKIFTGSSFSTV
uniref:Uncharacterized protein n=1 Tax=Anguilla anguilla TaxID=7936 RepID=A0A0E9XG58_ANGAN